MISRRLDRFRSANRSANSGDQFGWNKRRGMVRFSGSFDVIGNFPGHEARAGLNIGGQVIVTDRYLLIDEGAEYGFALPIHEITEVSADANVETFADVLIQFAVEDGQQLFRLRASRSRLPLRGRTNSGTLVDVLSDLGVQRAELGRTLADVLSLRWESVQSVESESVVWRGSLTAPLRPGLECEPGSVWLTRNALIWGSARGNGVNRLPTTTILRVASGEMTGDKASPIVFVRTNVVGGLNLDLPFIFDRTPEATAIEERDEFLSVFHPEIVTESTVSSRRQPWNDEESEEAIDDIDVLSSSGDEAADDVVESEAAAVEEAPEPTFGTWQDARRPSDFPYVPPGEQTGSMGRRIDQDEIALLSGANLGSTRLVQAISSWPGGIETEDQTPPAPPAVTEPKLIITYLARAKQSIEEGNYSIDRRIAGNAAFTLRAMPPASDDKAGALGELIDLAGISYYSTDQLNRVKSQIAGLGEAAIRIRSLIELCNAGHMSIVEVGAKRDTIMSSIAPLLTEE